MINPNLPFPDCISEISDLNEELIFSLPDGWEDIRNLHAFKNCAQQIGSDQHWLKHSNNAEMDETIAEYYKKIKKFDWYKPTADEGDSGHFRVGYLQGFERGTYWMIEFMKSINPNLRDYIETKEENHEIHNLNLRLKQALEDANKLILEIDAMNRNRAKKNKERKRIPK